MCPLTSLFEPLSLRFVCQKREEKNFEKQKKKLKRLKRLKKELEN